MYSVPSFTRISKLPHFESARLNFETPNFGVFRFYLNYQFVVQFCNQTIRNSFVFRVTDTSEYWTVFSKARHLELLSYLNRRFAVNCN